MLLKGRLYSTRSTRPISKNICTQSNTKGRSPRLDLLLGGEKLQPYIHHALISVKYRGSITQFHVFCKNHRWLGLNKAAIRLVGANCTWKGDIMLMRKGKEKEIVGMRTGDARLADFAVKK